MQIRKKKEATNRLYVVAFYNKIVIKCKSCVTRSTAVQEQKNLGAIQSCRNFIGDCPNHDLEAFYGDDEMSHRHKVKIFFSYSSADDVSEMKQNNWFPTLKIKKGLHFKSVSHFSIFLYKN